MLIATPNLCLDRTQFLSEVVPGAVMRAPEVEVTAGGKGVNIARVVRAFGRRAVLTGLVADDDRAQLLGLLAGEGAEFVAVPMPGRVRVAVVMIESGPGRITIVNEAGSPIASEVWDRYAAAVTEQLPGHGVLICSGSLPPGAPLDGYGRLVERAHGAGVLAMVDTAPPALRAALAAGPDLVAPNLAEAESAISGTSGMILADGPDNVRERAEEAARALVALGARAAVVTAGGAGLALATGTDDVPRWIETVPVEVVSAVGAGDSFLAGVALALAERPPGSAVDWLPAVLRGAATATASCEQLRAGGVDPARVRELLARLTARGTGSVPADRRRTGLDPDWAVARHLQNSGVRPEGPLTTAGPDAGHTSFITCDGAHR
ncbi:PfkB family carbohydrate kinase [Streptomyces sp. NPDC047000]|uniref:1-phosphofructokinase family hexose kinase n=1 Tax=Streptomyces sp. NPDC047000 TaxID=3155474 RepID=UPI0033E41189